MTESKQKFDFLGFTYINGVGRNGKYTVIHHTSNNKLKQKKQQAKKWLYENMHKPIKELIEQLNTKLIGHYRYYGISENTNKIQEFQRYVIWILRRVLSRRSQKAYITNARYKKILEYNPIATPIYINLYLGKPIIN